MENPPKVNRTVPYRAVPCSGKAPLDYTMELIYCLYFFPYELVWCSILYVCLGCYKCLKTLLLYYRVAWGGDKLITICDDITIVMHCGLWSGLKCADETDLLPRLKLRGRRYVHHVNFPRPLCEVGCTSKWQWELLRGEVLREVCECVSKSGVKRSPCLLHYNQHLRH